MALVQTTTNIEYLESDGLPMGETDLHREWMIRIFDLLDYRCRNLRAYVACNLLVYYEEGEPSRFVVPDVFVALGRDRGHRRVYKIWEEGSPPHVVFEVTSRATRNEDSSRKPLLYESLGIKEFFLYDPTSDYLSTPLQGFRLQGPKYHSIDPNSSGVLESQELDLQLSLDHGQLVLDDLTTGERLQTARQAAEGRAETAVKQAEAAKKQAEAAKKQVEAAEKQAEAAEKRAVNAEKRAEDAMKARQALEDQLRQLRDQRDH